MLRGVAPEVEVELRDGALDDAPHRLSEVGHETHQAQGSEVRGPRLAEIGGQQEPVLGDGEPVVDREVAKVEEEVAHAGVLPVDDPNPAVVEEVAVEEVVVAEHMGLGATRILNPNRQRPGS